jgi:hypothetical protein
MNKHQQLKYEMALRVELTGIHRGKSAVVRDIDIILRTNVFLNRFTGVFDILKQATGIQWPVRISKLFQLDLAARHFGFFLFSDINLQHAVFVSGFDTAMIG